MPLAVREGAARRVARPAELGGERWLATVWEAQALVNLPLRTTDGRTLVVVSPGHRCPGPGPDFRDAALRADDGTLWQGDLEVHGRVGDWRAHGHHRNPSYDGVMAHVVLDPAGLPAERLDGKPIPTIPLGPHLPPRRARPGAPPRPCRQHSPAALGRRLAALSLTRLAAKAEALAAGAPGDTTPLYAALLEALGHPHNRAAYHAVAARVPLETLRPLATLAPAARAWRLEARLLAAAGLLPSPVMLPPPDAARSRVMRALAAPQPPLGWCSVGGRPANSPARRLVAAAHLLARALPVGLPAYLTAPLVLATPAARWRALLERLVVHDYIGFWAGRTALGQPLRRPLPALVGAARARDLVLNVVLPFAFLSDPARAVETWRAAPPVASNWKERHVLRAAGQARLRGGAAQQGALHAFAVWCRRYDCAACPLSAGTAAEGFAAVP